jgi:hypothetical protein
MIKTVGDLGAGAYLLMHKWKPLGRSGKDILFEVSAAEEKEFEALQLQYLTSEFHRFDACIMSLKKMREYQKDG